MCVCVRLLLVVCVFFCNLINVSSISYSVMELVGETRKLQQGSNSKEVHLWLFKMSIIVRVHVKENQSNEKHWIFLMKKWGRAVMGECFSPWPESRASQTWHLFSVGNSSFRHPVGELWSQHRLSDHFQDLLGLSLEKSSCPWRSTVFPQTPTSRCQCPAVTTAEVLWTTAASSPIRQ